LESSQKSGCQLFDQKPFVARQSDLSSVAGQTGDKTIQYWMQLVRGEYLEVPGLLLTRSQVERLWGLDAAFCGQILEALIEARFLSRTREGGFLRAEAASAPTQDNASE
jgi:hypothetical protein